MSWHLKIIPMLPGLIGAIRNKKWGMVAKYIATILTIAFLGTGLVVLSGCGNVGMSYDSAGRAISQPAPLQNQQIIERIQTPSSSSNESEILAPK